MLRIGTIVIGAAQVRRAANFWCQALNYEPRDEIADAWTVLIPADGRPGPGLSLGLSESPVQDHPRVHLDLYAGDAADQAAEVERLVSFGAERVDWDGYDEGSDFVVLADSEGCGPTPRPAPTASTRPVSAPPSRSPRSSTQ